MLRPAVAVRNCRKAEGADCWDISVNRSEPARVRPAPTKCPGRGGPSTRLGRQTAKSCQTALSRRNGLNAADRLRCAEIVNFALSRSNPRQIVAFSAYIEH